MTRPLGRALFLCVLLSACRPAAVWTARATDIGSEWRVDQRGTQQCVTFSRTPQGCFDGVDVHSVAFDAAGRRAAYAVRDGARWGVAVDGVVDSWWTSVSAPVLSADGDHVAHGAEQHDAWHLVVDGVVGLPFDALVPRSVRFAPTGARVAYVARRQGAVHVVDGDSVSAPWREVGDLRFTQLGARPPVLAYIARDTAGWRVVRGATAGGVFEALRDLHTTPTGSVLVVATRALREGLAIEEHVALWHDQIAHIASSIDGNVAYLARDDSVWSVRSGSGALIERGAFLDLALGADGRLARLRTTEAQSEIVVDSTTFAFDLVVAGSLQFVNQGRDWAALVGDRATRQLRVVVNGEYRGQVFDWSELIRRVQQGVGEAAVRDWVSAEARRIAGGNRQRAPE